METWLILLSLVVPVIAGHNTPVEDLIRMEEAQAHIIEQQMILAEKQKIEQEHQKMQHETITEWLILRLESLGRIRYRSWRFDIEANAFDCSGLIKAYGVYREILTEQEAWQINSTMLYLLAKPKKISDAKRWDITYRSPISDGPRHVAVVTRDYDPNEGGIWIIDNAPGNGGKVEERFIQMRGDVFVWKWKILIASNPLYEIAQKKELEYEPLRSYQWYFGMTRYYAPAPNQTSYEPYDKTYEDALRRNCGWDCTNMASKPTKTEDINKTISCPPEYDIGSKFKMIDDAWYERIVTCYDRGGDIKGKRIDLFAWFGENWYQNLRQNRVPSWSQHLYLFTLHSKPINEPKATLRILNSNGDFTYYSVTLSSDR